MNTAELPLIRSCSCGDHLALLHGVWDPDTGQIEYQMALESEAEQLGLWAHLAIESVYASQDGAVADYRREGRRPYHDLLHADGRREVVGQHPPGAEPIPGLTAAQQQVYEQVLAEALQQDNYGDFHQVLARAGLLTPWPRPPK
jgi:hypothetical protein